MWLSKVWKKIKVQRTCKAIKIQLQVALMPLRPTSPDPKPQLGSIEILQVLAGELVQKIDNIRLKHHDSYMG